MTVDINYKYHHHSAVIGYPANLSTEVDDINYVVYVPILKYNQFRFINISSVNYLIKINSYILRLCFYQLFFSKQS